MIVQIEQFYRSTRFTDINHTKRTFGEDDIIRRPADSYDFVFLKIFTYSSLVYWMKATYFWTSILVFQGEGPKDVLL